MADTEKPTAEKVPDKHAEARKLGAFGKARYVLVSLIMFVPRLFGRSQRAADEVVVYSAPQAFYLWFVIAAGFSLLGLVSLFPTLETVAAWLYIFVIAYFFVTILYDLSVKKLLLWTGAMLLLWLGAKHLEHLHNVIIVGRFVQYFASLDPHFDHGTITILSWILLFPWIAAVFDMYFNGRKKFSPNEISEYHFGEGSELTDRSGLRFVTKYRDVLETILGFGGGDLLAVDNQQHVIKRYDNIIGLWFHWHKLDRILHQRATLVDDDKEAK